MFLMKRDIDLSVDNIKPVDKPIYIYSLRFHHFTICEAGNFPAWHVHNVDLLEARTMKCCVFMQTFHKSIVAFTLCTFIATSSPVVLYSGLYLGSGVMVVNKGGSIFGERQSHYPGNGQHPLVHITNGVWQQVAAVPAAAAPMTWSRLAW